MSTQSNKARAIFQEAIEQHLPDSRATFLNNACGEDLELRERVERLLRSHEQLGSFHEQTQHDDASASQPQMERPGTVIGPYKLLQEIGHGGMGVVYMAEQTEPVERRVALKIIKPGMDTRQVIARFEAERQALAMMDHPNIAKVLDAGTTDSGRPYFVMELVKGVSITQYCDEKQLTPKERLELFVPVCQAVQHAHQKGIIHRDIKPSNVLVALYDDRPVPKVIDFGVAKATSHRLTEKTMFTQYGQILGTIDYMSPEQTQLNQLDVDTRSDIYSLGVLLYELLTGETPLDRERLRSVAFDEMLRIIREEEPPKPSLRLSSSYSLPSIAANRHIEPKKLSTLVRGELDWIVMKALEKDRTRRYETANGLAADIQRYLDDEPVVACPPSAAYRFKKFARRNKAAFAIATVVGCALLVAVAAVTGSIGWAMRNRTAMQEQIIRDQAARHLVVEHAVEKSLEVSAEYMQAKNWQQALAEARRAEAALTGEEPQGELQRKVEERLKDLMMVTRLENIRLEQSVHQEGAFDDAGTDRKYAQAFREYGIDLDNVDVETAAERIHGQTVAEELVVALDYWADVRRHKLELDETSWRPLVVVARAADADPLRNRLRALWEQSATEEIDNELTQLIASQRLDSLSPTTLFLLAQMLARTDRRQEAIRVLRQAQQTYPSDFWVNFLLAQRLNEEVLSRVGFFDRVPPRAATAQRPTEEEAHTIGEAVRFYTAAMALRPQSPTVRHNLGNVLREQGNLEGAIREYKKAIELDPQWAYPYNGLGNVLKEQGDLDGAIREYRKAIELDPEDAYPHNNLGIALRNKTDLEGAIREYNKAIELEPQWAYPHVNLASILHTRGDLEGAIREIQVAIELDPQWAGAHHALGQSLRRKRDLEGAIREFQVAIELDPQWAYPHNGLGQTLLQKRDFAGAIREFRKAIELDPENADPHNGLGNTLHTSGDFEGAIREFEKAIELDPQFDHPHNNLGNVLKNIGDIEGAIREYRRAIELNPENLMPHNGLANALLGKGDVDDAIHEYRKAIELDPEKPNPHNNLANALKQVGDIEGAVREYQVAIKLAPQSPAPHFNLGEILREKGDLEGAVREFSAVVDLLPRPVGGNPVAWSRRGQAFYRAGRFEEAREALEKAIELRGDDGPTIDTGPRWWCHIMTLCELGETERAEAYFRQLDEAVKENLPDAQKSLRVEAAELLKIDHELTKEPDNVN
jgi:tetratricopeptide (TPR) repeat protein